MKKASLGLYAIAASSLVFIYASECRSEFPSTATIAENGPEIPLTETTKSAVCSARCTASVSWNNRENQKKSMYFVCGTTIRFLFPCKEADDIVEDSSNTLKKCAEILVRVNSDPSSYKMTEYPDTLRSGVDFKKLTSDSCVKVVDRITWCGNGRNLGTRVRTWLRTRSRNEHGCR